MPDLVTAGSAFVAVRVSAHPVFARVIGAFGRPLAAPSANRFGRISPTTGAHVLSELDGRIPLILDAGPTAHGVESTIMSRWKGTGRWPCLRHGPVTVEMRWRSSGSVRVPEKAAGTPPLPRRGRNGGALRAAHAVDAAGRADVFRDAGGR